MSKGRQTRQQILDVATDRASQLGLEGLSIGRLATELGISKSGLFAHFRSKENLQIGVLEAASAAFRDQVVIPALSEPRGEPRLRAMFENWLSWALGRGPTGGCLFVAAAIEYDDRPGAIRDELAASQRAWVGTLSRAAEIAVAEGHLRAEVDTQLMAYRIYSLMLGTHLYRRLLDRDDALSMARRAFEDLLNSTRA